MFDKARRLLGLGAPTAPDDGDDYREHLRPGEILCAGEHAGRCGPGCPGYEALTR